MVRRYPALLLTVWALWGLPMLCVGGVIVHPCAEDDECCSHEDGDACCNPDSRACPHDVGGCGHESDCDSDPCARLVVRFERSDDSIVWTTPAPVVIVDAMVDVRPSASACGTVAADSDEGPALSVHQSDLPLLI